MLLAGKIGGMLCLQGHFIVTVTANGLLRERRSDSVRANGIVAILQEASSNGGSVLNLRLDRDRRVFTCYIQIS